MSIFPKLAVRKLEAYSAVSEKRMGLVRMDLNENTSGVADICSLEWAKEWVSVYPEYDEIVACLSRVFQVNPMELLLTNGSDEALSVIASTFVEPGESVAIVSKPSFPVISQVLLIAGATLKTVPVLPDLEFNCIEIETALAAAAQLAIFASPDNPTGAVLPQEQIAAWCKRFPETLFVIDEAYSEYAGVSVIPMLTQFDNLLITRTFSKAWGLAGLRLGVVLGNAALISYLKRVRMPYSINTAAVLAAKQLLEKRAAVLQSARETMKRKERLMQALKQRGYKVTPGAANFFLLQVGINAECFSTSLRQQGVLVRNRSGGVSPSENVLWGQVRVSVGNESENERFLEAVDKFNRSYAVIFDLDGTLVDTSASYDKVISVLIESYSGTPLAPADLSEVRATAGFNDDWDATVEILRRRGITVLPQEVEKAGLEIYFKIAKQAERLLCNLDLLKLLRKRHPVFIVTGRTRSEYEQIWGETLTPLCDQVYCRDDIPGLAPKPAPDYLLALAREHNIAYGLYIGNSVDDMTSAAAAGMGRIGIASTLPDTALTDAGAQLTIVSVSDLERIFLL